MEFICPRCNEIFKRKDYLISHLSRRLECSTSSSRESRQSIIDKLTARDLNPVTYDCNYCHKKFNQPSCKSRHKKICKKNPINIVQPQTEHIAIIQEDVVDVVVIEEANNISTEPVSQPSSLPCHDGEQSLFHLAILEFTDKIKKELTYELTNKIKNELTQELITKIKKELTHELTKKIKEQFQLAGLVENQPQLKNQTSNQQTPQKKTKSQIPQSLRIATWKKYVGEEHAKALCLCCKSTEISVFAFHCAHVIAECMGGTKHIDNLRPVCAACNLSMGSQNLLDYSNSHFGTNVVE